VGTINTLFRKFIGMYLVVMIIGFIMLNFGLNSTLNGYFIDQKYESLIEQSEAVQSVFTLSNFLISTNTDEMIREIASLERHLGTRIWLINRNNIVYVSSGTEDINIIQEELKVEEIKKVFNGEIVKRQGYIHAISNDPVITIGYPIKSLSGDIVFALFSHASVPEITKTTRDVYTISTLSLIASVVLATLLIFLFSRRMTVDIKKLNKAVKYISKGNNEYQLEETRKDEIGQLAGSINVMAEELRNTENIRRNFISDVSHDLRSPLTSIIGYSSGLIDGSIPEAMQGKYLRTIRDESIRLKNLTNDILELSLIQSGEVSLNVSDINIEELLLNVIDQYEERILDKNVHVTVNFSKERCLVHCDESKIKRVLHNLIDNAVKFVNENGNIEIMTNKKEDKILVGIKNSGVVIPEDQLNNVWNRFSKLDMSRGIQKEASGLGLAIVKEIIHAHGEEIDVYSNEMIGVVFMFSLSQQKIEEGKRA